MRRPAPPRTLPVLGRPWALGLFAGLLLVGGAEAVGAPPRVGRQPLAPGAGSRESARLAVRRLERPARVGAPPRRAGSERAAAPSLRASARRARPPRLDGLAAALFSGAADRPLEQLRAAIEAHGTGLREPFDMGPLPPDPFQRAVAERIAARFELRVHAGIVAGAVGDLLLDEARADGTVDAAAFGRRFGPTGARFLRTLAAIDGAAGEPGTGDRRLSLHGSPALRARLSAAARVSAPPMRALEALVARTARHRPLAGLRVLGVQHLLGSTGGLVRGLSAAGVEPRDLALVGKPYSESLQVVEELQREGFAVESSGPGRFDSRHYTKVSDDALVELLERETRRAPGRAGRLLLIDDGARLIRLVHERLPELADRFVAVEQTRKGILELEGMALRFPVIDVAQSWAKRTFEGPMIGRSVARAVERKLGALAQAGVAPGRRVVLLGYGTVGRATALALRGLGFEVEAFDPAPEAAARARRDGVPTHATLEAALARGQVVVSATGRTTIDARTIERLPDGAVLVNAASGDTELDPALKQLGSTDLRLGTDARLSARFRGRELVIGDLVDPTRQDTVLHTRGGKELLLVNDGFVVNFTGEVDPIPPRYIQLTRGLLYLGALQAARTSRPGLHALDGKAQRRWVGEVEAELRGGGESLARPAF